MGAEDPVPVPGGTDGDGGSPGSGSPDAKGKQPVAILSTVKAAQAAHGLKHGDFVRYRQYCTRRLVRIRRGAGLTQGRGRYAARVVTAEDAYRDERALLVPLMTAERAWAAAMETKKNAQDESPGRSPEKARRRVILKLRRAAQAAEALRVLCVEVGDEQTVFEAEAYGKWMAATLDLENEQWAKALAGFEIVGRVYAGIVAMLDGSASAGVFEERVDEVNTAVRFCRYNLARSGGAADEADVEELLAGIRGSGAGGDDMLAQKIDLVLVESRKKAARNMGNVQWCGSDVPLRSESLREAVLVAEERSKALSEDAERAKSVDAYDDVFIAFNDAIQAVKKDLSEFREASTSRADERVAELDRLSAYLTYGRIKHTVARNLLLVKSLETKRAAKPDDYVRLYDNLIQNMTDVLALTGVDEDAALSNATEARKIVFRCHRCFHLAECYRVGGMLPQALALYDHVGVLAKTLAGSHADDAKKVVSQSRGVKCRVRANEFTKQATAERELAALSLSDAKKDSIKNSAGMPLVGHAVMLDHLDTFVAFAGNNSGTRTLVNLPPALEAVPCKPVLFDLAIDGVKFPEEPAIAVPEKKEAPVNSALNGTAAPAASSSTYFSRWFSSGK